MGMILMVIIKMHLQFYNFKNDQVKTTFTMDADSKINGSQEIAMLK